MEKEKLKKLISESLKYFMKLKGVKQKDIVNKTAFGKSYVSMAVNGKRSHEIRKLTTICHTIGISIPMLFLKVDELQIKNIKPEIKDSFDVAYRILESTHKQTLSKSDSNNVESDIKTIEEKIMLLGQYKEVPKNAIDALKKILAELKQIVSSKKETLEV